MQSVAHLTASSTGLLSRVKAAANHSFALNSVPVQPLKLVEMLGFMQTDQLLLIWQRPACEEDVFAVTAFVLAARAG